jgi:hypothetical protein
MAAFYPWLVCLFYRFVGLVRRDRFLTFRLLLGIRSEVKKIVHGMPEILFAAEIAFRGLDRCVPQKLNLPRSAAAVQEDHRWMAVAGCISRTAGVCI